MKIKLTVDLSSEIMQARRQYRERFKYQNKTTNKSEEIIQNVEQRNKEI